MEVVWKGGGGGSVRHERIVEQRGLIQHRG